MFKLYNAVYLQFIKHMSKLVRQCIQKIIEAGRDYYPSNATYLGMIFILPNCIQGNLSSSRGRIQLILGMKIFAVNPFKAVARKPCDTHSSSISLARTCTCASIIQRFQSTCFNLLHQDSKPTRVAVVVLSCIPTVSNTILSP